jgi:hypothetical protein
MKKPSSTAIFLVIGVLSFFLGLLMLLRQASLASFFSLLLPDIQTVELAGSLLQSFGGLLVVYGTVKFLSSEFTAKSNKANQAMIFGLMQSVERIEKGTKEIVERLDSMQKANNTLQASASPFLKCRFCEAKIAHGSSFCPNCGRSQK